MQQRIAIITLGVKDLLKSKNFYTRGFGWKPLHESDDTVFYQMNGFILSTWLQDAMAADMNKKSLMSGSAIVLAHNVVTKEEVYKVIEQLRSNGGIVSREADEPGHGGLRGYISDPDQHIWEIIWNPVWKIDSSGLITYAPKLESAQI